MVLTMQDKQILVFYKDGSKLGRLSVKKRSRKLQTHIDVP